jgi:hypothetical protein
VVITGDSPESATQSVIWTRARSRSSSRSTAARPGGKVDSLPGQALVSPSERAAPRGSDSLIPPQPRPSLVTRRDTTLVPLIILVAGSAVLVGPFIWWRRRGKAGARSRQRCTEVAEPPLDRWADDGEYRAVANVAAVRLRNALAQRVRGGSFGLDTERLLAQLAAAVRLAAGRVGRSPASLWTTPASATAAHPKRSSCPVPRWRCETGLLREAA